MIQLDIRTAQAILDYMWKDEAKNFMEQFDAVVADGNELGGINRWIEFCEKDVLKKSHIFYSLLQLQKAVFESIESEKERKAQEPKLVTCKFLSSEGRNDSGYTFKIHTTKKFYEMDLVWFKERKICSMRVIERSIQHEDKFITTVKWYSNDSDYSFDLSQVPKGAIIEYDSYDTQS